LSRKDQFRRTIDAQAALAGQAIQGGEGLGDRQQFEFLAETGPGGLVEPPVRRVARFDVEAGQALETAQALVGDVTDRLEDDTRRPLLHRCPDFVGLRLLHAPENIAFVETHRQDFGERMHQLQVAFSQRWIGVVAEAAKRSVNPAILEFDRHAEVRADGDGTSRRNRLRRRHQRSVRDALG